MGETEPGGLGFQLSLEEHSLRKIRKILTVADKWLCDPQNAVLGTVHMFILVSP